MIRWLTVLVLFVLLPTSALAGLLYGGTMYHNGELHTLNGSELRGVMIVQPDGLFVDKSDPNLPNLDWLFLVTANRSEGNFEFYMATGRDGYPNFGLFAWSCTPAFPCWSPHDNASRSGPAFMFNYPIRDYPQYVIPTLDGGGHKSHSMQFIAATYKVGEVLGVPRWRHELLLWNGQTLRWDSFWTHESVRPAKDCADGSCGGPGPALVEVSTRAGCSDGSFWQSGVDMSCPMPKLREFGFRDLQLKHDGGVSTLTQWSAITRRGDTDFIKIHPSWQLFHKVANRSFTVGNLANGGE